MDFLKKHISLIIILAFFLIIYFLPLDSIQIYKPINESMSLLQWYAREHVIFCLFPAFFIAGAVASFINKNSVIKYLGDDSNKAASYGIASVSGSILAVCSCTILPLFSGIYRMGAGLGPATAFLYAGPAINIMAVILTARVLGSEIGIARAIGAVVFSIILGLLMSLIFKERKEKQVMAQMPQGEVLISSKQLLLLFITLVAILILATLSKYDGSSDVLLFVYSNKWLITIGFSLILAGQLVYLFDVSFKQLLIGVGIILLVHILIYSHIKFIFSLGMILFSVLLYNGNDLTRKWLDESFSFARQILPLLFIGVLIAGFLLGRPGEEGLIPSVWISSLVGGESISSNLFSSVVGAFMYFATLTEIPILEGLMGSGMGNGPALTLLLAGPALSLPSMLVIRSVLGTKKMFVFVLLVIIMAATSGFIYGNFIQ